MINIVIDYLICIFQVYVFYDFLHDILEKRTENKIVITTILGVMSVLMYGINHFFAKEPYPFKTCLLIIIATLVSYVILWLIKLFLNHKEVGMRGKLLKMAFLFPVTTILIYAGLFYVNIQTEEGKIILCIGCMLLLFSNVLVFYIIEKLALVMEQNSKYELMELQNTLNYAYYGKLEKVERKHRQYAHNLKEYLQTIGGLAAKCKNEEIVDILKDMEVEIDSIPDKIYTNNSILNALLCEKELQAQKEGIEFHIMIEPQVCLKNIKNGDLIVMAGNLIDNAMEAAVLCKEQKRIDLKFFESDGNFTVLNIENSYGNKIKKRGDNYLSTKKDAIYHGIGIKSVREIAGRYGGWLFLEQKEDVFVSILTLSKSYLN